MLYFFSIKKWLPCLQIERLTRLNGITNTGHTSPIALGHWMELTLKPGFQKEENKHDGGTVSQNALAACDFKMNLVYVLPGWAGSTHDGRVLGDARAKGFYAPPGKYYLGVL
jgi:hypothetical protein